MCIRLTTMILAMSFGLTFHAHAEMTPAQIASAKKATALVEIPHNDARKRTGTAFCIDPTGIFVTSAVIAEGARGADISLVLNSSEKDQKTVKAKLLRMDKTADLAILGVEGATGLAVIEIGGIEDVYDTMPLVIFGSGEATLMDKDIYPSATVHVARVTSLQKKLGELESIKCDTTLPGGSAGGAVLDPKGRLVGVMPHGFRIRGSNTITPVSKLRALLITPEIVFNPPAVTFGKQHEPVDFAITVVSFAKPRPDYVVDVQVSTGPGDSRKIAARAVGDNFVASVVPVNKHDKPRQLRATIRYASGTVSCSMADQSVKASDRTIWLREVRRINSQPKPQCVLFDGTTIEGAASGLEKVQVSFGEANAVLDLSKAASIELADATPTISSVRYDIQIHLKDQIVAKREGTIEITGRPPAAGMPLGTRQDGEAPLEESLVIRALPAAATNICAGGAGRYLILHLAKLNRLALFDATEGKVTNYLTPETPDILYAAGADKLIIVLRDRKLIQRWNLHTLQKELSVPLPALGRVEAVVMGQASAGPVFLAVRGKGQFFDLDTLQPFELELTGTRAEGDWRWGLNVHYLSAASADGTTFSLWRPIDDAHELRLLTLSGRRASWEQARESEGAQLPSYDGGMVFGRNGIYSAQLKPVSQGLFEQMRCIPSYHPAFFLGVRLGTDPTAGPPPEPDKRPRLTLFTSADRRLLTTLPPFDDLKHEPNDHWVSIDLPIEKRIHYFPALSLLVSVPESHAALHLRRLRISDALVESGTDYLVITSIPPREAKLGTVYKYQLEVKSKRGEVQFNLDSGPPGMTITSAGLLQWQVPSDQKPGPLAVIVKIRDASGQEVYSTFKVEVK